MIEIDGSHYSGSGTVVRYAVALAALTGESLRITRIRSKRPKPGLRAQHLTVVRTCCSLCRGRVEGDEVGSSEIVFHPGGPIRSAELDIDVGTAGSTTMLAFSLIPPALFAQGPSRFTLTGGLFQDFAPSAFHMQKVLLPLLRRMGVQIELKMLRPGYVPKGGGTLEVSVRPQDAPLGPLRMTSQGKVERVEGISLASHLSAQRVAQRMAEGSGKILAKHGHKAHIRVMEDASALQKGAALVLWATTDTGCIIGSDQAGKHRRSSEKIASFVVNSLMEDLRTGATTDRHVADQLILFAALAEGITEYTIPRVTDHVEANLWLVETILGAGTNLSDDTVTIEGIGYWPERRIQ